MHKSVIRRGKEKGEHGVEIDGGRTPPSRTTDFYMQPGRINRMTADAYDIVVVGAGNAAFCAAFAARETGLSVLMLERAAKEECGGNSRFTAGAFRVAYRGVDDLKALMPDLTEDEINNTDFGSYTTDQFFDDMFRVTRYRTDPELCEILVRQSYDALRWLRGKGVRFAPIYGRQAFKVDGRFKFWGGLTVEAWGGGPGLVEQESGVARKNGINISYSTRALSLIHDGFAVKGIRIKSSGGVQDIRAGAVVLACGGFESNTEWRTRYLGPGWELAKVRGTRFNTGDGIRMALEIGASPFGNWSGCHAVGWDYNAPEFGDLDVGDGFQKHSYPWGIMVNVRGRRFVDEGADFRNYTYAKYGRVILEQPDQFAWQVFDRKVLHLLRDEYRIKRVTKVSSDTIEGLAEKLEGVDKEAFLAEIGTYNTAVQTGISFNPNVKDGRRTEGLAVPKSNWANRIDEPPFEAYQVGCGLTFTFGGLRIDPATGQVIDTDMKPIPGLYAAGELVGGIFYFNYPGGTGLMSGTVFGRLAGSSAAESFRSR
jgi:tricarballylate dehydrogenase